MSSGQSGQLDTHKLAELVRSWVHFDNLAATFNRQTQQARSARFRYEEQIMEFLRSNRMTNAIIQIAGGRLTMHEEKHAQPLTLQRLESILNEFYMKKNNNSHVAALEDVKEVMAYIKENRGHTLETKLRKS
jgi:hypothetical protein